MKLKKNNTWKVLYCTIKPISGIRGRLTTAAPLLTRAVSGLLNSSKHACCVSSAPGVCPGRKVSRWHPALVEGCAQHSKRVWCRQVASAAAVTRCQTQIPDSRHSLNPFPLEMSSSCASSNGRIWKGPTGKSGFNLATFQVLGTSCRPGLTRPGKHPPQLHGRFFAVGR